MLNKYRYKKNVVFAVIDGYIYFFDKYTKPLNNCPYPLPVAVKEVIEKEKSLSLK